MGNCLDSRRGGSGGGRTNVLTRGSKNVNVNQNVREFSSYWGVGLATYTPKTKKNAKKKKTPTRG